MSSHGRDLGWWVRRTVIVGVVVAQTVMVIRAYGADHAIFGYQMFPESSTWRAEIVRVTPVGEIDVRQPWPGDYRWGELVVGRGLGNPFADHHADAGLASTLGFLEEALAWVAANTPLDTETRYLEARVTYWENGRGPSHLMLISPRRGSDP